MRQLMNEDGTTLVEAVVAAGLLVTVATSTAALILLGHQMGQRTEQSLAATSLAAARLEALTAVPWDYDAGGGEPDVEALALTAADALDRDLPGHSLVTDATGVPAGSPGAESPRFVVRWAVWAAGGPATRAVEVCVFPWPAPDGVTPLVCLASARVRQP